jgi:DNA mismatch repair protein MutS
VVVGTSSDREAIVARQDAVAEWLDLPDRLAAVRDALADVQDVDRLLARLSCGRATARELVALRASLARVPVVRAAADGLASARIRACVDELPDLSELRGTLERALVDDPPIGVKEGGFIRRGYDAELDGLHVLKTDGHAWIAQFQQREIERTGIPTLKVAYNRVFGWYIEITNVHAEKVPGDYVRRSTVKNAERYITQELKEFETKVLGAEERIHAIEYRLFTRLRDDVLAALPEIQATARALAELDVLAGLAQVARETRACRPEVHDGIEIDIREGRHPVLATQARADAFVPNDLVLDAGRRLVVITGPNMAGKSTYIRQCALLVLMAQAGSLRPRGVRAYRIGRPHLHPRRGER